MIGFALSWLLFSSLGLIFIGAIGFCETKRGGFLNISIAGVGLSMLFVWLGLPDAVLV